MKADSTVKTWEKTKLQNLVRHKSGRYYARFYLDGKEIWKSLKTDHFTIAESRLAEALKEHRQQRGKESSRSSSKMTFGDAGKLHLERIEESVTLKKRTKIYWKATYDAMMKSWPELAAMEVRKVTNALCRKWAAGYAKKTSAARYNNSLSLLKHVLDMAIECGVIYSNPATGLDRRTVHSKKLELPTLDQFAKFIGEMRSAHSRDSQNCADFAEGLAYTGCRKSEAGLIEWQDLDFQTGEIVVKGDPIERTKNGDIRRVPMIPGARKLFERMRAERPDEGRTTEVFKVRECEKSMTRAAKKIGMMRVTHHDLRHFFATVCIESGVDIPTVSRWLGHKDGGALAMKTYGHLRREHSLAQAQKVSFAPAKLLNAPAAFRPKS